MELLSKAIFDGNEFAPVYGNFHAALDGVFELAQKEKLIFIIDEFPYLAQCEESIISILQQWIDLKLLKTNMMLILAGSSLSFMENQVLGYQSPLYGRRTGQIKLLPVDFQSARLFVPELSKHDQAVIFGTTGAIPKYLSLFTNKKTLDENLRAQFFDKNAYLFEETENLLKQEFDKPALYQAIITAIAGGASQMKDIKNKTGEESSTIATYIKLLLDTGIVKKEVPAMDKTGSRKTIYRLDDGMFRFWYRFVFPNQSLVALGKGAIVYDRIKAQITAFMGEVFEKLCIEYMWCTYDTLPFEFQHIGRWWGNNPLTKSQSEIDFIAYRSDEERAIFGECKWTNEMIDKNIVEKLIEKSRMFGQFTDKWYYLFSKSGFTPGAHEVAKKHEGVNLVSFDEMFEI